MTFTIKQSDTSPSLQATLQDGNSNPVNLNGATVKLHMKPIGGSTLLNTAMTIVNAAAGIVKYNWQTSDTSIAGTYYIEFEVTYADLSVETFPNTGNMTLLIVPEIG
jgi:hypothetical protein